MFELVTSGRHKRRGPFIVVAAVLTLTFLAVGCGAPEITTEPPRGLEAGSEEPVSQIGQGGTARVALPASTAPVCFNPYLRSCEGIGYMNGVVFEGLLQYGPSGEARPLLATELPSYSDETLSLEPMSIEVRIREGATFSDGEPVTAQDVAWTYDQAMELAGAGAITPEYSGFDRLENIEVEGRKTLRLEFERPYAGWRDLLTAPVLPEHVYGEEDLSELMLADEPVGSGPFLLDEFRGKGGIDFTASPRYWTSELEYPRLDGLVVEYQGPADAARSLAYSNADFGVFVANDAPGSGDLMRAPALRERTELLVFNSRRLDEDSRASLYSQIDRTSVAGASGLDVAETAFSSVAAPEESPFREASGAGSNLVGASLRLAYPAGGPVRDRAVEEVVASLEEAGASVEVERIPGGEFYASTLPAGDFDLTVMDLGSEVEYESLFSVLPENSASAIYTSLGKPEDEARYLARTQEIFASEYALAPLYRWPDSYAWSSTLSGPMKDTPSDSFAWNIREWGFYK
ncbi:MAG: ABC transporter substrate-binding protein [Rubrobacter sp.]